ncbi:MAG: YlbF family regulator [Clostridia bacterium]|nr:YlbF family regulator [Clostridia bacterium]
MRAEVLIRARELARALEESEEVRELRAAEALLAERGTADAEAGRRYREARLRVEALTGAVLDVLSAALTGGPAARTGGCASCGLAAGPAARLGA